jgi:deoxyribonuclease-4
MKGPDELRFATAGIPISTKSHDTLSGISRVRELGLGGMELEFVHSINITKDKAPDIKIRAHKENVLLTCHAPYFINLNAIESAKKYASMQRIEKSAEILYECGGWSVCFHPGFYLKMEKETVFETVKARMKEITASLSDKGVDVWIRPETTGKETQFGNLTELLKISQEIENIMPVIDFSHLHARSNGNYNTKEEFTQIMECVEKYLGKEGLNNMHIHVSGIEYSAKGERKHLNLKDSDLNYQELIEVWKEFRIKGIVICESPNIEADALLLQKIYNGL